VTRSDIADGQLEEDKLVLAAQAELDAQEGNEE
jgi:hypothetical protein